MQIKFLISLVDADVTTATVLISMGAVLGRTSYLQLVVMGLMETVAYTANSYVGYKILKVRRVILILLILI